MLRTIASALSMPLLLLACALNPAEGPGSAYTLPPREIACDVDEAPPGEAARAATVHFMVDEDGFVVPGSARVPVADGPAHETILQALEAVTHCTYEPALHKGLPVRARHHRTFRFPLLRVTAGSGPLR